MTATTTNLAELLPGAARSTHGETSGVLSADGSLTNYITLERHTAALAHALIESGVRQHDRVVVLIPKSLDSFVAMHAIIRAGAIAVPLDPFGAQEALRSVLDQTEPTVVLGEATTMARLIGDYLIASPMQIVALGSIDVLTELGIAQDRMRAVIDVLATPLIEAPVLPTVDPEDPAYIIFTSGSTGTPKGIVHTHRSALAYAERAVVHHELVASSRLAGTTSLHFDMSTLELYAVPLAHATAVTITEAEQRFPATLSAHVARDGVTHLYAVPFLLRQLAERGALAERDLASLTHISYGGEPYSPAAIVALRALLNDPAMLNVYGPAEVNAVTTFAFRDIDSGHEPVPIGKAWPDVDVHIVDEHGEPVPHGHTGELLISAATCMSGYWRQPELTAEKFTSREGHPPWYASGDMVYERSDGNLMFVGRKDHQVKIRGVRVEVEATEAILSKAPGIVQAVVGKVSTDETTAELVAWVVLASDNELDMSALRRWCRTRLSGAAMPSRVLPVSAIPAAPSGKIDRRKLAKMTFNSDNKDAS